MTYLYARDSKDKIRVLILKTINFKTHWEIHRSTGLLDGKLIDQPVIRIDAGKVKRTMQQQCELEFRSIVNKQRDKGYKTLQELLASVITGVPEEYTAESCMDPEFIGALLPNGKTYADGQRKLMLAKDPKAVKTKKGFNWDREWWVSRKLDGIRAAIYYDEEGNLQAISRNGITLNPAFEKIFKSKKWKTFFNKLKTNESTDIMVDGELYCHGVPLATLSGLSQKKEYDDERHKDLEFWIFDFADEERNAEERATLLNSLAGHFTEEDPIRINAQVKLSDYESIKKIHDIWVLDGFEGAICRDASRLYGFGTRDERMVKVKEFQEKEFEIIGLNDGDKRAEDMTFTCRMKNGLQFKSKPVGTALQKLQYIRDFDNIVGKMLTVKFFNYTPDGIPFINTGKCIRDYE
jgi:hypothetical protein